MSPKSTSRHATTKTPRGEVEVRRALIDAGTVLFAARGPAAVSVREIAQTAGVNHGLVHHYFGSKDGLITAVLDHLAAGAAEEVEQRSSSPTYADDGPGALHGRILAYLLLSGSPPSEHKTDYPTVRALVARLEEAGMPAREARRRAAQVMALVMGWQFFEPFLTEATGLELSKAARKKMLDDAVHRLLH